MSVSVNDARYVVMNQYHNPTWRKKVRNMPDKQVLAIYFSMLESGKFDKPKNRIHKETEKLQKPYRFVIYDTGKQLSFEL